MDLADRKTQAANSGLDLKRNPSGSVWHRWDPHLHAPGTLLSDQFKGDWGAYVTRIKNSSPAVKALGVTDYFSIGTYRDVKQRFKRGELGNVEFIFPNVELRLDIKTEKKLPINIHLLFSPADENHEAEIERILGHLKFEYRGRFYACSSSDLAALGREHLGQNSVDEHAAKRAGATQFKVSWQDLRNVFRQEKWLRHNCLVAVAGSSNDGTAGLQADDSYALMRQEIERFADIIFASTPSQVEFWLGRKEGYDRDHIEGAYGTLKPCLHGSDAHREERVAEPSLDRFCWLKGDLTFETLRQAAIEPEDRVWIGSGPPYQNLSTVAISKIVTLGAPWLAKSNTELNQGLVAIVGARGSGKTALAEIIARGAHAQRAGVGDSSFLRRALNPVDYLGEARVQVHWADGSSATVPLSGDVDDDFGPSPEDVQYLSQHFVENLCSRSGVGTELRTEMERVVFESTDQAERFETDSFGELLKLNLRPIIEKRRELQESIVRMSSETATEDFRKTQLPILKADLAAQTKQIALARANLTKLVPKGQKENAEVLARLESATSTVEAKLESLRRRRKELDELVSEVSRIRKLREPERFAEMKRRFAGTGLTGPEWSAFEMSFKTEVDAVLKSAIARADVAIKEVEHGNPKAPIDTKKVPFDQWPLTLVRAAREEMKKKVGVDKQQRKKFTDLQQAISRQGIALKRCEAQIEIAEGSEARRQALIESRRAGYEQVFETLVEEQRVLEQMYAPLGRSLGGSKGTLGKLQFAVRRVIRIDQWVGAADRLFDFRMESEFRLRGSLQKRAEEFLLNAWKTGTGSDVAAAMEEFRGKFAKDFKASMPPSLKAEEKSAWTQKVAAWLYSTEHISIEYEIQYEGVAVEQLSPGTRGIVLLLLYLAVDLDDVRPLIIDQPEENLDPNSVFEELVPHFREARKRRQVIIVTHNANLVVNTDADQVIVAHSKRQSANSLPLFSYDCGALENTDIRTSVCQILEGGERAFLERERRYRLRWEDDRLG